MIPFLSNRHHLAMLLEDILACSRTRDDDEAKVVLV